MLSNLLGLLRSPRRVSKWEYTPFVAIDGYLLDREVIWSMYNIMKELFLFLHSVFALAVSLSRTQGNSVALSRFLCADVKICDDLVPRDDDYVDNNDSLSSEEEDHNNNCPKQRV